MRLLTKQKFSKSPPFLAFLLHEAQHIGTRRLCIIYFETEKLKKKNFYLRKSHRARKSRTDFPACEPNNFRFKIPRRRSSSFGTATLSAMLNYNLQSHSKDRTAMTHCKALYHVFANWCRSAQESGIMKCAAIRGGRILDP